MVSNPRPISKGPTVFQEKSFLLLLSPGLPVSAHAWVEDSVSLFFIFIGNLQGYLSIEQPSPLGHRWLFWRDPALGTMFLVGPRPEASPGPCLELRAPTAKTQGTKPASSGTCTPKGGGSRWWPSLLLAPSQAAAWTLPGDWGARGFRLWSLFWLSPACEGAPAPSWRTGICCHFFLSLFYA